MRGTGAYFTYNPATQRIVSTAQSGLGVWLYSGSDPATIYLLQQRAAAEAAQREASTGPPLPDPALIRTGPVLPRTVYSGLGQALAGRPLSGVGGGIAVLGVYALIVGGAGYLAGRAMAPSAASAKTYKWGGAVANMLLPGIGLGIVGALAGASRG